MSFRNFILLLFLTAISHAAETPSQRVGLPLVIEDQYLSGPLLEPVPRRDREPSLVVRILETKPAQDGFRYTFEVQGLDAGTYNLGEFLREATAESGHSSHQVPLTITTELPPGLPRPADLEPKSAPEIGGYRTILKVLGVLWLIVLAIIINSFRKKKAAATQELPPPTLAERLKPLVQKASQETLSTDDQAQLERLLVGHWRKRLPEIANEEPAKVLRHLREHREASPLILQLEKWLHAPNPDFSSDDLDQLLAPYRS